MKITVFTSNQPRHNYLINSLKKIASELYIIQENRTIFPDTIPNNYPSSSIMKNYFSRVKEAENFFFSKQKLEFIDKKVFILPIIPADLNKISLDYLSNFLSSDLYIVFGSSYIKGELVKFLIKKKALNIHMGISPYYRGTDCNFWALYDGNPHLVGSTIHYLSEGLDSGDIAYNVISKFREDPFLYTMSTVKGAIESIVNKIKDYSIFDIQPLKQDKSKEIRYSKNIDFNENVVENFFSKKIVLNNKKKINFLNECYIFNKINNK